MNLKKSSVVLIVALLSLTMLAGTAGAASPGAGAASSGKPGSQASAVYIVKFAEPAVASYTGGVAGLAATSPQATGERKLNVNSAASVAYHTYLSGRQADFIRAMEGLLGRTVDVKFQYIYAYNGLAVELTAAEAARVAGMPDVVSIQAEKQYELATDVGPAWIGAPTIWTGGTTSGVDTMGEGVIVGVLDTGINSTHPSFADVGGDGYNHTNPWGSGVYVGVCDPGSGQYDPTFVCNDKLIGAWTFVSETTTPEDSDGHGSHTASTAAGNVVDATMVAPTTTISDTISGVAPHANVVAYDVCVTSCPGSALLAAADQAISDGVDVINYSISGGDDPWSDPQELAFLDDFNAGIFVSASAGNNGPGAGTAAHSSPWVMSVGASTHNRLLSETLYDMTGGVNPPADITGQGFTAGYGPARIVYAGDYPSGLTGTPNLCGVGALGSFISPWPPNTFHGEIVLCDRGTFGRVEKGANVLSSGAGGYVLADNGGGLVADPHVLPGIHISQADGVTVKAWLATSSRAALYCSYLPIVTNDTGAAALQGASGGDPCLTYHMATISGTSLDYASANGDIMAGFSSRGPSQHDILIPSVTGPGVSVWAAYCNGCTTASPDYTFISGTSMSSPHDAGAAALMVALHPTWSPAQIKSAMMLTAYNGSTVVKEDGVTPADPFDMGSGRINLAAASNTGIVLDETGANFLAADPDNNGDPRTLNIASMADNACGGICVFTRTVESVSPITLDWEASVVVPAGVTATVTPSSFTLASGASQEIVIEFDASGATPGVWVFADVKLTPSLPVTAYSSYTAPTVGGVSGVDSVGGSEAPGAAPSGAQGSIPTGNVLWDNGPLVTHPGGGAGGADASRLQNTSLGMTTNGFNHGVPGGFRVSDGFSVLDPEGWTVDDITFYAYQTGSTTTSTFTNVNVRIWDGPPNAGGKVIWGDTATNLLSATGWSGIYREAETSIGSTSRPIMWVTADLGGIHLPAGDYWVDWQTDGSIASGPWAPPITIIGQATTGDAVQWTGSTWANLVDSGSGTQQGLPFVINGTVGGQAGVPAPAHMPVALQVLPADINVSPPVLSSTQVTDTQVVKNIDIENLGATSLDWDITEDNNTAPVSGGWSDNFDSYANNTNLHGVGGWKGWDNSPAATAFVRDDQALSTPHSVEIMTTSDLVQEYSGYTSGGWAYTTWQYIPSSFTGDTYFLLLNEYNDGGPYNWSTQVHFTGGNVINDGISGGTTPIVFDEWVEIRVEIDLTNNTQAFFYDGNLLYLGTWTEENSGGGQLEIQAVDLYANGASAVYYDDMSLEAIVPTCAAVDDIPWASLSATSGTTAPFSSESVDVTFDSTGLGLGTYTGNLCVTSNDPDEPLVIVPLTLTVDDGGGGGTPVEITHSSSQTITPGNSVACSGDGGTTTTDNQYLRHFDLDAFGLTSGLDVTDVEFGVEAVNLAALSVTVNLYRWDGISSFTYANFTLLGSETQSVGTGATGTIVSFPVTGSVPAGDFLVVEVATPDTSGVSGFFIGSNTAAETAPSYLASTSCGLPNPLTFAGIGFPGVRIVMNVIGIDPALNSAVRLTLDGGSAYTGPAPAACLAGSTGLNAICRRGE
jgi:hypothetical protein